MCTIDGCDRPHDGGWGMCKKHWTRWRSNGDPLGVLPATRPFKYGPTCSVDGCNESHKARGYCGKHYVRFRKYGDPTVVGPRDGRPPKGGITGYDGAHKRVTRSRGPATAHMCVDCDNPAQEWSYSGADTDELVTDPTIRGEHPGLRYSLDPNFYDPRCKKCHRAMDLSLVRGRDPITGQWVSDCA